MSEAVTGLLIRWGQGDQQALDELLPIVYEELRRMARKHLRGYTDRMSLQPTTLLHEAYLKLVGLHDPKFENRARFFAMSTTIMRNILVDHVRERLATKRGGGQFKISLSQAEEAGTEPDFNVLLLDDALKRMSAEYPKHAQVVEFRYFGGFSVEETAQALELSPTTVKRHWQFAKAWLRRELGSKGKPAR
ncbi:MAG TPA: sigma-70 family RNA polymerase sigma factor [Candidatus Angelobacter sp.]|nr:sigma-70 family RNA polymerase sigma factor [Candidatus Angelobacter sp.]